MVFPVSINQLYKLKTGVLTICLLLILQSATAQYPPYFIYNDENGLPSNEVYSIIQDKKGFIWFGCDAGLFKYDGIRYTSFKCATQKSKSIAGLCLSSSGKLYCHNFQSQIFYLENDTLKELNHTFDNIPNIITDKSGKLFVNHSQGIASYNEATGKWQSYYGFGEENPYNNKLFTRSVRVSNDNRIYFLNTSGIGIISNGKLNISRNEYFTHIPPGNFISCPYKNDLWIFCNSEPVIYLHKNDKTLPVLNKNLNKALKGRKITGVKTLSDDKLWICTYTGLIQYDPEKDAINVFYPQLAFSDCAIDRENSYWFTTLHAGILRVPNLDSRVWGTEGKVSGNEKITKVTGDCKNIYFATGDGYMTSMDMSGKNMKTFHTGSYADIQCLDFNHADQCLYFYLNGTLYTYKDGQVQTQYHNLPPIKSFKIINGNYIAASSFGAYIYPLGKPVNSYIITNNWAREIAYDSLSHKLWIATNNGLLSFIEKNTKWVQADSFFVNTQILSLDFDKSRSVLYILSFDGNIYSTAANGKTSIICRLPSNIQGFKLKYEHEHLYLATNKGLWIYTSGKWKVIDRFSGLASDNVQSLYIFNSSIWLATGKGLQQVPLASKECNVPPLIYLKKISINHFVVESTSNIMIDYKQTLNLVPEVSSYNSFGDLQYAYRIRNADESWNFLPGNIKTISIPNIPPGDFEIELKAIDHFGNNSRIIKIKGHVSPPVWKTWWFYLILTMIFVLLAFLFFRLRIRQLKDIQQKELNRLQLESELHTTQQTALKAQMNPHFIFNVLNSIKGYIYENDKKNAINYLNSFSRLVRQVLDNSSRERLLLREEIDMLNAYIALESMLLHEPLDYTIYIDPALDTDEAKIPGMLLQPYVENAFKHGLRHKKGKKELSVRFELSDNTTLVISIYDNGIGRQASGLINQKTDSENHTSFSGNAIHQRMKLINQSDNESVDVQIIDLAENGQATGTMVIVTITLKHEQIFN